MANPLQRRMKAWWASRELPNRSQQSRVESACAGQQGRQGRALQPGARASGTSPPLRFRRYTRAHFSLAPAPRPHGYRRRAWPRGPAGGSSARRRLRATRGGRWQSTGLMPLKWLLRHTAVRMLAD